MNNATKMTALVAVLGLCLAALAGSAYAYNATYVDTIEDQPIENVYVAINNNASGSAYGETDALDLDIEYNTFNNKTDGGYEMYYNVESATVTEKGAFAKHFTASDVSTDKRIVKFTGIIDSVKLQAYGDDAKGTLTISGLKVGDGEMGISSIAYTLVDEDDNVIGTPNQTGELISADIAALELDTPLTLYLKAEITVCTLKSTPMYLHEDLSFNSTEDADALGVYYAPEKPVYSEDGKTTLLKDITVDGVTVMYKFEALQATA